MDVQYAQELLTAGGNIILIGDCDTTYDFLHLDEFYRLLSFGGYDMVIGNRFRGQMEKNAMALLHRLGVSFLSTCGRMHSKTDVHDFHGGLHGLTRQSAERLELVTDDMGFATEMIVQASRLGLRIGQVSIVLRKCYYDRKSKFRMLSDGFRHLGYIISRK